MVKLIADYKNKEEIQGFIDDYVKGLSDIATYDFKIMKDRANAMKKSGYGYIKIRFKRLMKNEYSRYLTTRYWKLISKEKKRLDNYKCVECGKDCDVVHHTTYDHVGEEFNYMFDLKSLCHDCHRNIHQKKHDYEANQKKNKLNTLEAMMVKLKPVVQFDKHNRIIKEWSSIEQASKELKINMSRIIYCCRIEDLKLAGKSYWRFKNEDEKLKIKKFSC